MEKVGLVPAAGYARRLGKIHGSKEMIPIKGEHGMEPICHSLLRQFRTAGIKNIVFIVRKEKTDLLQHVESSLDLEIEISTIILESTNSTLESIVSAYELIRGKGVYLGFPDMLLTPPDAMNTILEVMAGTSAEVVMGAFPANNAGKADMIEIGTNNKLKDIVFKNPACLYEYAWIMACWKSNFTEYLYSSFFSEDLSNSDTEIYIGNIFLSYLKAGHRLEVHRINRGKYVDIGTAEDLASLL